MLTTAQKQRRNELVDLRSKRIERDKDIILLATSGTPFREIATIVSNKYPGLGLSRQRCQIIYKKALTEAVEPDPEKAKQQTLGRLERLVRANFARVLDTGNTRADGTTRTVEDHRITIAYQRVTLDILKEMSKLQGAYGVDLDDMGEPEGAVSMRETFRRMGEIRLAWEARQLERETQAIEATATTNGHGPAELAS